MTVVISVSWDLIMLSDFSGRRCHGLASRPGGVVEPYGSIAESHMEKRAKENE